jgi:ApeA N-terminal domain 1
MTDFPKLSLEPGRFAAEWYLDNRPIAGELQTEANRPPHFVLFEDLDYDADWSQGREIPEERTHDRVLGRLRSNEDVVLTDVAISIWAPGLSTGFARYAVVGLGVGDVVADRYASIELQITGAELLFGTRPIKSVRIPTSGARYLEGTFSAESDPESTRSWEDHEGGLTLDCSYSAHFSGTDPFRHELIFAPIVRFTSTDPLTVDEWVKLWITPLLRVASLATRGAQRLSWLRVEAPVPERPEAMGAQLSGAVFGGGIDQAPYQAEYRPEEWQDPDRRPLFTLAGLPLSLVDILRQWRDLAQGQNPFLELYSQAMLHTDLPLRARYLYLIQALEGLHAYEHRAEEEDSQRRFEVKRTAALEALTSSEVDPETIRFIKQKWSKRMADSLDRRISELVSELPEPVGKTLARPEMCGLAAELATRGATTLGSQLRVLRNDLSHGGRNYDSVTLRPWVQTAETLCRGHALRLLGFRPQDIEAALVADAGS